MSQSSRQSEQSRERTAIRREIERLSPFLHDLALPFGLRTVLPSTTRRPELEKNRLQDLIVSVLEPLQQRIGSLAGLRVLEVACNCGGLAIEAANRGAEAVLGIDPVPHYIEQALFLKRALDTRNVEFEIAGIEDTPNLGRFDVTICCGLLYHLESPVASMRAVAQATNRVLALDTQVVKDEPAPVCT